MMSYKKFKGKHVTVFLCLCLMAALALFSRFWVLDKAPFRADEMDFHSYAVIDVSIVDLWQNPPWLDQIPLNKTLNLLLVKAGLPATPFVTRLPFALFGLLTLLIVWRFARRWFSPGAALFVLILAIFNPYALYHAREAYYYSGAICVSAAMFSVFWAIKERLQRNEQPGRRLWVLWFAAAALACHMHMCVWIVASLQALLMLIFGLRAFSKNKEKRSGFLIPFFTGCALLGLVMSRWIYRAVQAIITQATEGNYLVGSDAGAEFLRLLPAYFAGENGLAVILLLIFIALTVRALFGGSDCTRRLRSLAWICALHFAVVMLYVTVVGRGMAKITYFSGMWAQFVLLMGVGAYCSVRALLRKNRRMQTVLQTVLVCGYILLTAVPDWAIIQLEGKPTPYYKINEWVLNNLLEGTPVLTDRWWEPWNELDLHDSADIAYAFTVPDEPLETFQQNDWRTTAEQFFEKFPESAFLELQRGKYEQELGPWAFPQTYFARVATITNEPALVLHRWNVLDFADAYTNRVITRIYYNTPEDLVASARKEGREVLRLYGAGWGYIKPAYKEGDYVDCRTFCQAASIDLYNLKDTALDGLLVIDAVVAEPKVFSVNDQPITFPAESVWAMTITQTLQPGRNVISFTSLSDVPLYVFDIRWESNTP